MSKHPPKSSSRSGSVVRRVAGSAPAIGKVNRMTNTGDLPPSLLNRAQKGQRSGRRRRSRSSKAIPKSSGAEILRRWLALILGLAGVGFCGMIVWTLVRQSGSTSESPSELVAASTEQQSIASLSADEAVTKATQLIEAQSPEELEPLIMPGKLGSAEAIAYLETVTADQSKLRDPIWIGSVDSLSVPIEMVGIPRSDAPPILIFFTPDESGSWKADFDAISRHCEPTLEALLGHEADEGLVRLLVTQDSYYNGIFRDENEWACYAMLDPDTKDLAYGYCKRDSAQERALVAVYKRSESSMRAGSKRGQTARITLQIKRLPDASPRQFQIVTVLSDDWVLSDRAFDETYAVPTAP